MANKTAINAFESRLQAALKGAAIDAAASLFTSNPNMTLEDFYTVMRPQGVTESITLGEIASSLLGEPQRAVASASSREVSQVRVVSQSQPSSDEEQGKKPKKIRNVDCRTAEGRREYEKVVLAYLRWVDDWVSGPEIRKNCGGSRSQLGTLMRDRLVPKGFAIRTGNSFGTRYKIGKKKAVYKRSRRTTNANGKITSRTIAGREAYRASILKFLHGNKWRSGPEISRACGGNPAQRKRMLNNLISEGLVEHNGELTSNVRYRLKR